MSNRRRCSPNRDRLRRKMNIVFLEPLGITNEDLKSRIDKEVSAGHEITYHNTRAEDVETLIKRSEKADIVVLSNIKYQKEVIEKCSNLKMICVAFTGVDHVDIAYCKEKGIDVCNCAGYSTVAVADIVFAMVINLARNIIKCDEKCKNEGTKDGLVGFELAGKKFGIIGMGAIGERVANIANAFGCEVFASSRTEKNLENVTFVDKETLLKTCDIISLHIPQTPQTINYINKAELDMMKSSALLINTARGPVVNSNALANALKNGDIAGAGIDVFETEPPILKSHPLFDVPNIITTPHIAFATKQAFEKRADIVAKNIKQWLCGNPQNIVHF